MRRLSWPPIVARAAEIALSFSVAPTLRQVFYRLVSEALIPNTRYHYNRLSDRTAIARREGRFPGLVDQTRNVERISRSAGIKEALLELCRDYTVDRTAGQPFNVYLGVEKRGMVAQLGEWFGEYGVSIVPTGGYASQSFVDSVRREVEADGRPAVLLYAGDFDPSGEDIDRDFVARSGCWERVIRIALTAEQVDQYRLPPMMGKASDSRAAAFVARHGRLVQVELDALSPDDLRDLYRQPFDILWDMPAFEAALKREKDDRARLLELALGWEDRA